MGEVVIVDQALLTGAEKGRVAYALEAMLRLHCVQLFYNTLMQRWKTCSMRRT